MVAQQTLVLLVAVRVRILRLTKIFEIMEMITSATIFKSFDGKIFMSEIECKEYEKKRKEFLDRIEFFLVRHSPDLNETGLFTNGLLVAVYSIYGRFEEIVNNYCIKRFGYLGESVQGYRFQTYFSVAPTDFETYSKGEIDEWRGKRRYNKILLSPKDFDEFKGIERFDYMKEWGFK